VCSTITKFLLKISGKKKPPTPIMVKREKAQRKIQKHKMKVYLIEPPKKKKVKREASLSSLFYFLNE